jgi:hypothetical protein
MTTLEDLSEDLLVKILEKVDTQKPKEFFQLQTVCWQWRYLKLHLTTIRWSLCNETEALGALLYLIRRNLDRAAVPLTLLKVELHATFPSWRHLLEAILREVRIAPPRSLDLAFGTAACPPFLPEVECTRLLKLLTELPCLEKLEFVGAFGFHSGPESRMPSLKRLAFHHSVKLRPSPLRAFLKQSPRLEELIINEIYHMSTSKILVESSTLTTLVVKTGFHVFFVNDLDMRVPNLKYLDSNYKPLPFLSSDLEFLRT